MRCGDVWSCPSSSPSSCAHANTRRPSSAPSSPWSSIAWSIRDRSSRAGIGWSTTHGCRTREASPCSTCIERWTFSMSVTSRWRLRSTCIVARSSTRWSSFTTTPRARIFECDEPGDEPEMYGLRQKGYSRDLRPDRRQIVIGLAVDQNGLPITSDVYSGETSDSVTVVPMLTRLRALGLSRVVWVADRGMASELNLSSVRAAGLHYVVGIRLRAAEDLRAAITADPTPYRNAAEGLLVKDVRLGAHGRVLLARERGSRPQAAHRSDRSNASSARTRQRGRR